MFGDTDLFDAGILGLVALSVAAKSRRRRRAGPPSEPPKPAVPKVGRNEHCPCGSGAKYKRCCGR